jgi:hypothetical protein
MDCDRIEECNLSTQPYYRSDIRAFKAKILANNLYLAIGVQIEPEIKDSPMPIQNNFWVNPVWSSMHSIIVTIRLPGI